MALTITGLSKTYSNGVKALKNLSLTIGNLMFGRLGPKAQEFGVYPKISAIDMLQRLAVMKGVTDKTERKQMLEAIPNQTNLWDARKKALSTDSGGMKQRFGIAQALLAIVEDVRELCPRTAIVSSGEVLLEDAPAEALEWRRGNVVSAHLIGGRHEVRVYAEPGLGEGFRPVDSSLEDVCFLNLSGQAPN